MSLSHTAALVDEIVLSVRDLSIEVPGKDGPVRLVSDVSFDVRAHEVFGIVGESGSGKSLTMLAVLGLLPPPLKMVAGSVKLRGQEISTLSFEQMRRIRGKTMSIVFQDPMTTLNPVLKVGQQIGEAVVLHNPRMTKDTIRARVIELLNLVGIPDPERRYAQYPHVLSGGMRQRVVIAIAMANEPDLLIADEPTTALDVTIQAQVMRVLADVRSRTGAAMVLITHDLGLVAETADHMAVMYGGRIMEQAPAKNLFEDPQHPYTAGLIASLPRVDLEVAELFSIPGFVPDPAKRPSGCVFQPRCDLARDRAACRDNRPEPKVIGPGRKVACHFGNETRIWREERETALAHTDVKAMPFTNATDPTPQVRALTKEFVVGQRWFGPPQKLKALRDISFDITKGRTLSIVGESGCGKSTLARVILRLLEASGGSIFVNGESFMELSGPRLRSKRRHLQVVFQDPYSSLDPRMTIHEVVAEPMRIHGIYEEKRVDELLIHVGLPPHLGRRKPVELSGGQRQRVAIARALALNPDILILDEAVSALDVSIQAQIINLLKSLQNELGLTYVFISHNLSVVRHISDDVAVMYLGRIVESGPVRKVFASPAHPYTQALLSSIPHPGVTSASAPRRIILSGDLPDPTSPPSGCSFRTRCFRAVEKCAQVDPELLPHTGPNHMSACHFSGMPVSEFSPA